MNRRGFLKSAGAIAVAAAFPGRAIEPLLEDVPLFPLLQGELGTLEGFTFYEGVRVEGLEFEIDSGLLSLKYFDQRLPDHILQWMSNEPPRSS